ncbi:hypothetical protein ABIE64_002637 [Thalassospira sp. MBR-102]
MLGDFSDDALGDNFDSHRRVLIGLLEGEDAPYPRLTNAIRFAGYKVSLGNQVTYSVENVLGTFAQERLQVVRSFESAVVFVGQRRVFFTDRLDDLAVRPDFIGGRFHVGFELVEGLAEVGQDGVEVFLEDHS